MCRVSRVTCHVSPVTFNVDYVYFFGNMVELVAGGSVINGATRLVYKFIADIFVKHLKGPFNGTLFCKYNYL